MLFNGLESNMSGRKPNACAITNQKNHVFTSAPSIIFDSQMIFWNKAS